MSHNSFARYSAIIVARFNNIGVVLQRCDRLDEAQDLFHEALRAVADLLVNDLTENELTRRERICAWEKKLARRELLIVNSSDCLGKAEYSFIQQTCPHAKSTAIFGDVSNFSQTLPIYTTQMQVDSNALSVVALYNMALIHMHRIQHHTALQLLEMVLSIMPSEITTISSTALACIGTHHNLGVLHYEQGEKNTSIHMFMSAILLGQNIVGDHILLANTFISVGHVFVMQGYIMDAMEMFHAASQTFDRHTIKTLSVDIRKEDDVDPAAPAA